MVLCILLALSICCISGSQANGGFIGASGADPGEAAAGNYGETSITYSSSGPYTSGWTGSAANPYSFKAYNPRSQTAGTTNNGQAAYSPVPQTPSAATGNAAAYTFPAPSESEKNSLQQYNILTGAPSEVLYKQAMLPWTTFVSSFPKDAPMLWVNTYAGWQWYSTCPLGGWLQEIMFIPKTGTLKLYETYPDRTVRYYNYGYSTPGYHYIWFNGDTPGRHSQFITVDDMPSNAVDLDAF